MLCLTRRKEQAIVIADGQIVVKVLEVRGACVRLGVDAPDDVTINRGEVHEAIMHERGKTATATIDAKGS